MIQLVRLEVWVDGHVYETLDHSGFVPRIDEMYVSATGARYTVEGVAWVLSESRVQLSCIKED